MNQDSEREPTLGEIELEVLAEGREWMRRRLEQKLQERAERISRSFSPRGTKAGSTAEKEVDAGKQRWSGGGGD
jgi:hypothetical protein